MIVSTLRAGATSVVPVRDVTRTVSSGVGAPCATRMAGESASNEARRTHRRDVNGASIEGMRCAFRLDEPGELNMHASSSAI